MSSNRVYLYVPFEERERVKSLGAKWDGETKRWYVSKRFLSQYRKKLGQYENPVFNVYYNIPFDLKDEAKQLGARWDKEVKKWYALNTNEAFTEKFAEFQINDSDDAVEEETDAV